MIRLLATVGAALLLGLAAADARPWRAAAPSAPQMTPQDEQADESWWYEEEEQREAGAPPRGEAREDAAPRGDWAHDDYGYYERRYDWEVEDAWFDAWYGDADGAF